MLKFAVFVSGGGTDLQSIIDAKNEGKINGEIALVLSNRQKAYGLQRAKDAGIETAVVKKDDALIVKMLKERNIDFIVLAGYLAILTDELIDAYPNKIMNIHPSLIPSFCGPGMYGMHVHEAVLQRGAKVSGATVHFVSNIVDGGPIIKQVACDISDLDTAEDIQKRVLEIEHKLLPEVVGLYCDNNIKIIPSTKTAVNAISHEIPLPITTENAKKALSPIPDANPIGSFAYNPISIHENAADKHVAVTNAPCGIPVALKIDGFTAII